MIEWADKKDKNEGKERKSLQGFGTKCHLFLSHSFSAWSYVCRTNTDI